MSDVANETEFDNPTPNQRMSEAVFGIPDEVFETMDSLEIFELVMPYTADELGAMDFEVFEAISETFAVHSAARAGRTIKQYFTPAKRGALAYVEPYIAEDWPAPPEADLGGDDSPEAKLERFCRVRHQVHLRCNDCNVVSRLAVRWYEDGGFVYPFPRCAKKECASLDVTKFDETYIERTPRPNAFDPEPKRTRAWRESVRESELSKLIAGWEAADDLPF